MIFACVFTHRLCLLSVIRSFKCYFKGFLTYGAHGCSILPRMQYFTTESSGF